MCVLHYYLPLLIGFLRVCTYCCKVVLSYAQNPEVSNDLGALSEDLQNLSAIDPEIAAASPSQGGTGQNQDVEWPTLTKKKGRQIQHSIFEEDSSKQR